MAEATRSLSPNQITQRLRNHRAAVDVRAHQVAINAVKASVRRHGLKLKRTYRSGYPRLGQPLPRRSSRRSSDQALSATSPLGQDLSPGASSRLASFVQKSKSDAQTKIEPISITSTVQMSGAK